MHQTASLYLTTCKYVEQFQTKTFQISFYCHIHHNNGRPTVFACKTNKQKIHIWLYVDRPACIIGGMGVCACAYVWGRRQPNCFVHLLLLIHLPRGWHTICNAPCSHYPPTWWELRDHLFHCRHESTQLKRLRRTQNMTPQRRTGQGSADNYSCLDLRQTARRLIYRSGVCVEPCCVRTLRCKWKQIWCWSPGFERQNSIFGLNDKHVKPRTYI